MDKQLGEKPQKFLGRKKRRRGEEKLEEEDETESTVAPYYFKMGALSVVQLGRIDPRFHSSTYLFPVDFTSKRMYWSYKVPGTRTVYTCRILSPPPCGEASSCFSPGSASCSADAASCSSSLSSSSCQPSPPPFPAATPEAPQTAEAQTSQVWDPSLPVFEIVAQDDPLNPIRSQSSTQSWLTLLKLCGNLDKYEMRSKTPSGDTCSFGLSGPYFFGFGHPVVMQMLERLPHATECTNYSFISVENGHADEEVKGDSEGEESEDLPLPVNASGCARTEGYDVYRSRDRQTILNKPAPLEKKIVALQAEVPMTGKERNKKVSAERDERDKPVSVQYHIMKGRKGRTVVSKSSIHEWGLFSGERLEPHTMVIEYLGELVRQKVADVREKRYEASGEGSCYMFRIDKDNIVDGTKKGNTSRFINHSCDPNCYTKVISVEGAKKIVVFANRLIEVGDEVTYDYFFAAEDTENKITCNCGSYNCAGRLN